MISLYGILEVRGVKCWKLLLKRISEVYGVPNTMPFMRHSRFAFAPLLPVVDYRKNIVFSFEKYFSQLARNYGNKRMARERGSSPFFDPGHHGVSSFV